MEQIEKVYEKKRVLKKFENFGEVFTFLDPDKRECELFKSKVKRGKKLGKGTSGTVFELIDKKTGKSLDYVMKITGPFDIRTEIHVNKSETLTNIVIKNEKIFMTASAPDLKLFLRNNKITSHDEIIKKGRKLVFIENSLGDCLTTKNINVTKNDRSNKNIIFEKGTYICSSTVVENVMTIVLSAYVKGRIIHFPKSLSFMVCPPNQNQKEEKKKGTYNYLFIEKFDQSVSNVYDCFTSKQRESLFIQSLAALIFLQRLKIVHNDLNPDNIFVKMIDKKTTFLDDESNFGDEFFVETKDVRRTLLYYADYFSYDILDARASGQYNIYAPFTPAYIKLGDFGFMTKHSKPKVLITPVLFDSWQQKEITPNFYSPITDVIQLVLTFYSMEEQIQTKKSKLIYKVMKWIFGKNLKLYNSKNINFEFDKAYTYRYYLFEKVSALSLMHAISYFDQKKYSRKPFNKKIVLLGRI